MEKYVPFKYARLEAEFKLKMVTFFSLHINVPPIPTDDFLLHQIDLVQQDSDHDGNEWEEESEISIRTMCMH